MSGIFDIFTTKPAVVPATPATAKPAIVAATSVPAQPAQPAAAIPAVAPPGNIPDKATPSVPQPAGNEPNGVVPEQVPAVAPVVPDSPLAEFSKLWDTAPVDPNKPSTTPAPLDTAAVQKAVAKTDFSTSITPETLTAIAAGGEDAQKAFATAMNQVAQQVMVQSISVNDKLTQKAIKDAMTANQASMQEQVRSLAAHDHLNTTNPLFSNPAVKPVIEATQAQLLLKFPNATAAEITTMTQNYIVEMGKTFAPVETINDNSGLDQTDWSKFV